MRSSDMWPAHEFGRERPLRVLLNQRPNTPRNCEAGRQPWRFDSSGLDQCGYARVASDHEVCKRVFGRMQLGANAGSSWSKVLELDARQQFPRGFDEGFDGNAIALVVVLPFLVCRRRSKQDASPGGFGDVDSEAVARGVGQRIDQSIDK